MKKYTILPILLLALLLCLCTFTSALADNTDPEKPYATDKAAITKILITPFGTDVTGLSFTFTFTKESLDGKTTSNDKDKMPAIGPIVINTTTATKKLVSSTDEDIWYFQSANFIDENLVNDFLAVTNPLIGGVGVYKYSVTETGYGLGIGGTRTLIQSSAKYDFIVYVLENTVSHEPEIKYIGVTKTIKDNPLDATEELPTGKLNPTPGEDPEAPGDFSEMSFKNKYHKTNSGTNPENQSDWKLYISKKVTGVGAEQTEYFYFKVTITVPSMCNANPLGYKGYVLEDQSGTLTKLTNLGSNYINSGDTAGTNPDVYFAFKSGTELIFKLKHNQYLVFTELPVGTKYTVAEVAAPTRSFSQYLARASVIYNGGEAQLTQASDESENLALPNTDVPQKYLYVGEVKSCAEFTNHRTVFPVTGIKINDLPFLGLIAIAILAFAAYITLKLHRRRLYN
ncbi:MAG: hypothetical protein FWG61_04605 [Firmicutes bacterium]|nr:hypothetical protein [Bacillota bacterium]